MQHRFTSLSKLSTLVSTPDIIHDVLSPRHLTCRHVAHQSPVTREKESRAAPPIDEACNAQAS